jgi:hypothetical protein
MEPFEYIETSEQLKVAPAGELSVGIFGAVPAERFRMDQMRQQFSSLYHPRAGTSKVGTRVHGVYPLVANRRNL